MINLKTEEFINNTHFKLNLDDEKLQQELDLINTLIGQGYKLEAISGDKQGICVALQKKIFKDLTEK